MATQQDVLDSIDRLSLKIDAMKRENEALRASLVGFMEDAARVAQSSFARLVDGEEIWNDDIWQEADPDGFALYVAGSKALEG